MQDLYEIEKIKQLKGRYMRSLDTNDWLLFASVFTPDCAAQYAGGKHSFNNREEIVRFMSGNMSGDQFLSMHHAHHPEIDLMDENSATGIWYLQDIVIDLKSAFRIYGAGIYHDEYQKIDGEWLISNTGYERTFECGEPLPKNHMVMENMFTESGRG